MWSFTRQLFTGCCTSRTTAKLVPDKHNITDLDIDENGFMAVKDNLETLPKLKVKQRKSYQSLSTRHMQPSPFPELWLCEICGKSFPKFWSYRRHLSPSIHHPCSIIFE